MYMYYNLFKIFYIIEDLVKIYLLRKTCGKIGVKYRSSASQCALMHTFSEMFRVCAYWNICMLPFIIITISCYYYYYYYYYYYCFFFFFFFCFFFFFFCFFFSFSSGCDRYVENDDECCKRTSTYYQHYGKCCRFFTVSSGCEPYRKRILMPQTRFFYPTHNIA